MDRKEGLKWLNENFSYIDSVTIVDNNGRIIVKQRYNPRYTDEENRRHNEWSLGKNMLELYPSLTPDTSTLHQVLQSGRIVYRESQEVWSHTGRKTVCNTINFPIIFKGKILGVVELSRDVTHLESHIKPVQAGNTPPRQPNGAARYHLDDIITCNGAMLRLKETISKVANSASSVLICGATGTGKELVASSLHNASYRKHKPFVAVNCAALPETILEGLLFGSRKGAFTGAENRKGLFEEADGGTLYLDEINSMPMNLQAKLLRVLQEKQVMPLGSNRLVAVDVRIVASSNRTVEEMLQREELRPDLLYRLNTVTLHIPPLSQRTDDIPLLIDHFLQKYSRTFDCPVPAVDQDAMAFLTRCPWNGNVRELEHAVEAAMNVLETNGVLTLEHLPAYLTMQEPLESSKSAATRPAAPPLPSTSLSLPEALEQYERQLIVQAMAACHGKIVDAAALLKIPRTTLQYKLEKHHLPRK